VPCGPDSSDSFQTVWNQTVSVIIPHNHAENSRGPDSSDSFVGIIPIEIKNSRYYYIEYFLFSGNLIPGKLSELSETIWTSPKKPHGYAEMRFRQLGTELSETVWTFYVMGGYLTELNRGLAGVYLLLPVPVPVIFPLARVLLLRSWHRHHKEF